MSLSVTRVLVVGELEPHFAAALREIGVAADAVAADSWLSLVRAVRKLRPQVIYARAAHIKAALVGRASGVPVVIEARAWSDLASVARAARIAPRTVCGGAALRDALLALGAPPARTSVLRGLVDGAGAQRTRSLESGQAPRWVVCAAPLDSPDRGVSDLLLAFFSVARTRLEVKLLLAGPGDGSQALAQADAAGLRGRVACAPADPSQLPALLAGASVVVGPSRSAAYVDAIPEAMASCAPVVATSVGAHPSWVRDGKSGFLVPARAPVALAARLAQLLDEPALASRMGDCGRQLALDALAPRTRAIELSRSFTALTRPLASTALGARLLQNA